MIGVMDYAVAALFIAGGGWVVADIILLGRKIDRLVKEIARLEKENEELKAGKKGGE